MFKSPQEHNFNFHSNSNIYIYITITIHMNSIMMEAPSHSKIFEL